MNYERLYQRIIDNRINTPFIGYTERHHIVPKSLGGDDNPSNLVDLTAREHFVCHLLLTKIYTSKAEGSKMIKAFVMMLVCHSSNQSRYLSSRKYEQFKKMFAQIQSEAQTGTGNSQHDTMWIHSFELEENKKIPKGDLIPSGWIKGRVIDWQKHKNEIAAKKEHDIQKLHRLRTKEANERIERLTKQEDDQKRKNILVAQYREWLKIYEKVGFNEFVIVTGYKFSKPNLVQRFAALLPEFVPQNGKRRAL